MDTIAKIIATIGTVIVFGLIYALVKDGLNIHVLNNNPYAFGTGLGGAAKYGLFMGIVLGGGVIGAMFWVIRRIWRKPQPTLTLTPEPTSTPQPKPQPRGYVDGDLIDQLPPKEDKQGSVDLGALVFMVLIAGISVAAYMFGTGR